MAKKAAAKLSGGASVPASRLKSNSLLDARVLKKAGSFYYHCDWRASHYVKVMLDQK